MKRIFHIITISIVMLMTHFSANAVTDKEMEQARTIATKAYLRYANDGSGYLDQIQAKTMAELEKNLKPKEKENLKAFKAIPVPSDYKSWDKQKLVEYWGVKAFTTPGLVEKGRIGRNRAKKNISAMTVTPPSNETEKKATAAEQTKPKEEKSSTATSDAAKADAAKAANQQSPSNAQAAPNDYLANNAAADSTAVNAIVQAEAAADALAELDDEPQLNKADNHTWVYILILCILVAVVCALVVFASNVMKKNEDAARASKPEKQSVADSANANALREKFAATLNSKNEEIKTLSKKIEALNSQNATLKTNLEGLTAEIASLRTRLNDANRKIADMQNAAANLAASMQAGEPMRATAEAAAPVQPAQPQAAPQTATLPASPKAATAPLRTIYLGRANAKGIFVRADRNLNLGNSIYRLDTTDGYAGSFRVANDPTVWEMALLTPRESLLGACVIAEPEETAGMTKIVNDTAGTAVFEGGCWRVIRKAKVHYE